MEHRLHRILQLGAALAFAAGFALSASAATVSAVRVMLHPYTAEPGTLPPAAMAKLQALAGLTLTLAGTTRTGALELALPEPLDEQSVAAIVTRMRDDRAVIWAQPVLPPVVAKSAKSAEAGPLQRRLLVKLADGVAADWASLAPRFTERLGMPVTAERDIAGVWVLSLLQAPGATQLAALADLLQQDPLVQYADPVRNVRANFVPNDPLLPLQWSLVDPVAGINAPGAWDLQTGLPTLTVAVIDTGIVPHPELAGRILPGFDFIADAASARDGNGRDPDPRDEGTWGDAGLCGYAQDSFWHGLFIAGQIAANTDNGTGIAGVNWRAQILPVRALGACGNGTTVDVFEAMLWASGVQIFGVPPNPTPARVINMSLGGYGSCGGALQQAVDLALAQGTVIVVSAGNESDFASNYVPAGCAGVITVGAHSRGGIRSSYSNFGSRVDLSAPGGDFGDPSEDYILSTFDTGVTIPGGPAYAYSIGTSFAAPLVAGTASLMISRNPNLTAGRVQSILEGTTRDFPPGTQCAAGKGKLCGTGMLDAATALASTVPSTGIAPPGAVSVVEYYRADYDHYFITADPCEIYSLDTFATGIYQRTGGVFYAYASPAFAPLGVQPVCRFFASGLINSHFFTASASECQFVQSYWVGVWNLELSAAFWIEVPDGDGNCLPGRVPVYRFFNNRGDANHRHTLDLSERRAMVNRAWVPEGYGARAAIFCSPI